MKLPKGFLASGVRAGIRKKRPDLGLIVASDVGPKVTQASFTIGGKRGRIVGVAKGAGMIHPNMATMLGFVMTDAAIDSATLYRALKTAVDHSFNSISVDGDTSTNDTVLLLASRKLGNGAG